MSLGRKLLKMLHYYSQFSENTFLTMSDNVWLYYANLIGYARILFAIASFYWMPTAPVKTAICYTLSAAADAVDGYVARLYNQCTFSDMDTCYH